MERLVDMLKAGADPTRVKILCLCSRAELSVGELTRILGQSQPRVSRHLKILAEAGLLDRYREGQFALFRRAARGQAAEIAASIAGWADAHPEGLEAEMAALAQVMRERAGAAAQYFASNAADWDSIRRLHIADEQVEAAVRKHVGRAPIELLVDLGTGTGRMIEVAGPVAGTAVGIDLSRNMLSMARGNLIKAAQSKTLGFDWQIRQGDVHRLPLEGGVADVAIMHQVLHFLEDPPLALAEAARILKPGGRLILVDFARHRVEALRDEHAHTWLGFADSEVTAWLRAAGLRNIGIEHLPGDPLTITIWTATSAAVAAPEPPAITYAEAI